MTFSSVSNLATWRDKSTSLYTASNFGTPVYAANVKNTLGVIQFATGGGVTVPSFVLSPQMSVFMVYYPNGQGANGPPIEHSSNSSLYPGFLVESGISNFLIRTNIPAPSGLTFSVSGTTVVGAWSAYTGASTYFYTLYSNSIYSYNGTAVSGATGTITAPTATFTYSSPVSGTYYYYTVSVTTSVGTSLLATSGIVQYVTVTALTPSNLGATAGLWVDAADKTASSMTFATGTSNLTVWKDKSASANNFSLTSGTTTSVSDGGYNVVSFPSGAIMTAANRITWSSSGAFFFVSKLTSSTGFCYALGFSDYYTGDLGLKYNNGVLVGTQYTTGGAGEIGSSNYYVNGTFNPNFDSNTYYNKYAVIDTVTPVQSGTSYVTLSSSFLSRYFVGNIAEFLVYPSGVTSTQRQQLEGYLAWKWGLQTSLSNGHPYSNAAPVLTPSPTAPTLSIVSGTATLGWTAASGATSNYWTLYRSTSNGYYGTSNASGTTTGSATAPVTAPTGLTSGAYWYFTVAASNVSGLSPVAVSSIVSY
jgi:hypothetical protein